MCADSKTEIFQDKVITLDEANMIVESGAIIEGKGNNAIDIKNYGNLNLSGSTIKNIQIDVSDYGSLTLGNSNSFDNVPININETAQLIINDNSTLSLTEEASLFFSPSSTIKMRDCSTLNVENIADYSMTPNTDIYVYGNATISGDFSTSEDCSIIVKMNSSLTIKNSNFNLDVMSKIKLEQGAELIIDEGSVCTFPAGADVAVGVVSKITVNGTINSNGTIDHITNIADDEDAKGTTWQGIRAGVGSSINLTYTNISNAQTALSGAPSSCDIIYSSFSECENGVELTNCNDYYILNNTFSGIGIGTGLTLNSSSNYVLDNIVENYGNGVEIISCRPILSDNTIKNNENFGLHITGYTAYPQLITPSTIGKNNDIILNGAGQIYLKYSASAYMSNGRNNIYSEMLDGYPIVPCVVAESYTSTKVDMVIRKSIPAEYNYWGAYRVNDDFFSIWQGDDPLRGYYLDYDPYERDEFLDDSQNQNQGSEITYDERMLSQAVKFEIDGKLDQAINKLEMILDVDTTATDFEYSEEYYLALAKLPDLYVKQEIALDPLVKTLDSFIESDDETINKKFFKGMKVSTYIKSKRYDEAINLAEEMKLEASSEGEVLLAEIDIAIANMMKDAENKGKGGSKIDQSAYISDLLAKLKGNEDLTDKTDIVGTALPTAFSLYQNYPNPFNPTTEIRFALPTAIDVKLNVYNINGQLISELVSGSREAGIHTVNFDASNYNSGMYFYALEANGMSISKKMILTK